MPISTNSESNLFFHYLSKQSQANDNAEDWIFLCSLGKGKSLPVNTILGVCVTLRINSSRVVSLGTVACPMVVIMLVRTWKKIRRKNRKTTGEESSRNGDAPMYLRYLCCHLSRETNQNIPNSESPLNNSAKKNLKNINSQAAYCHIHLFFQDCDNPWHCYLHFKLGKHCHWR